MNKRKTTISAAESKSTSVDIEKIKLDAFNSGLSAGISRDSNDFIQRSIQQFNTALSAQGLNLQGIKPENNNIHSYSPLADIKTSRSLASSAGGILEKILQVGQQRLLGKNAPKLLAKYSKEEANGTYLPLTEINQLITNEWKSFSDSIDIDVARARTFMSFLVEDLGTALPRDGSVCHLVHLYTPSPDYEEDAFGRVRNKFGMSMQQVDSLHIDRSLCIQNDNVRIQAGVELNLVGKPVAIYINASEDSIVRSTVLKIGPSNISNRKFAKDGAQKNYLRVPILDEKDASIENGIFAVYYTNDIAPHAEYYAGKPWYRSIFGDINSVMRTRENIQVFDRLAATLSLQVVPSRDGSLPQNNLQRSTVAPNNAVFAPGSIMYNIEGHEIKPFQFEGFSSKNSVDFMKFTIQNIASVTHIPYAELSGDNEKSSWSTEIAADSRTSTMWRNRRKHLADHYLNPLARFWLLRAIKVFAFGMDVDYSVLLDLVKTQRPNLEFQFDDFMRQNETSQVEASEKLIAAGLSSPSLEAAKYGHTFDEVLRARASDQKLLTDNNIRVEGINFFQDANQNTLDLVRSELAKVTQSIEGLQSNQSNAQNDVQRSMQSQENINRFLFSRMEDMLNTLVSINNSMQQYQTSTNAQLAGLVSKVEGVKDTLPSMIDKDKDLVTRSRVVAKRNEDGTIDWENTFTVSETVAVVEEVTEEVKSEEVTEEVKSEEVTEEVKSEEVTEEVKSEEVTEEVKSEEVSETSNTKEDAV